MENGAKQRLQVTTALVSGRCLRWPAALLHLCVCIKVQLSCFKAVNAHWIQGSTLFDLNLGLRRMQVDDGTYWIQGWVGLRVILEVETMSGNWPPSVLGSNLGPFSLYPVTLLTELCSSIFVYVYWDSNCLADNINHVMIVNPDYQRGTLLHATFSFNKLNSHWLGWEESVCTQACLCFLFVI